MTSFLMTSVYLQLLINILCQERMGGEEQHLFLCFEALETETHSCYGKYPCKFQQPHAPRKHWNKWESSLADDVVLSHSCQDPEMCKGWRGTSLGVTGKGQRGDNLALGLGSLGCHREGAGIR